MPDHARPGRLRRAARTVRTAWATPGRSRHRAPRSGPNTPPLGVESYTTSGLDGRAYRYVLLLVAGSFLVLFVLAGRLSEARDAPPAGSQYQPPVPTQTPRAPRTARPRPSPIRSLTRWPFTPEPTCDEWLEQCETPSS